MHFVGERGGSGGWWCCTGGWEGFFFGLVRDNCWDGVICIALGVGVGARVGVQTGVFPVVIANASQSSTPLPLLA